MADVNANIGINIDTSQSLAEIKNLQRQLAQLYTSINRGSAAAAAAQKGLATNLMNTVNAGGKFYAQMGTIRTSTESFTHALEKNKLTMREYFRFAGGSTRTFGRLFKSEFDTIGRVAEERVKKMQTQYVKLGRDASGAMRAISITPTSLNMKDYGNQVAVASQKQAILNQLLKQGSTNLLNFGKNTQWAGRQLMVGFTVPLAYFGAAAAKTFMDLEAQALKFRRVYGDMFTTTEQTNKALADIEALAKEFTKYGVAVTKTMEMAASAAAMGRTGAELTAQVAQATRLAVLGNVEQDQALLTTISLTDAFGLAAEDLAGKINFLNSVENQTITAIEDLTIAIPKAGPVVKQLGGSVEDLAFFLTAMREGGINASEGANALKSGLASLINPTEKAAAMLADMGINIKGIVEGNVGNLKQTVIDFANALDTLAPLERSRAIEQLFGKFQFARLSTLFENVTKEGGQAARVLDLAAKSVEELAILSERELGAVEDAVGTNFREAVEQLKLTIAPIGKEFLKAITPVVKFLGELFEKFGNLSDGSKKFIVILTAVVGLLGPTLLMTFGLLMNGVANTIKLFTLMRQGFLKLSGNSTNLAQQTQYLSSEQMEAAVVAASLNQAHTRLTQQFTLEASAVNQLRNAYVQATAAAARFAATNPGMMIPGAGKVPKKFNYGTMKVPGYSKGTDSVPAMLTPGEAVIPEPIAQDDRFKPLIAALVSGEIAKYKKGTVAAGDDYAHVGSGRLTNLNDIIATGGLTQSERLQAEIYRDVLNASGKKAEARAYGSLAYSFDPDMNKRMATKVGVPFADFERAWNSRPDKWISSGLTSDQTRLVDRAILETIKTSGVTKVTDAVVENAFKNLPDNIKATPAYQKMISLHSKVGSYSLGRGLGSTPQTSAQILEQAKKSGLIKDYRVDTREGKNGKIKTRSLVVITNDGREVNLGRGSRANRVYFSDKSLEKSMASAKGRLAVAKGEEFETKSGKQGVVTGQTGSAKPSGKNVTGSPRDTRVMGIANLARVLPYGARGMRVPGAIDGYETQTQGGVRQIPFSAAGDMRVSQSKVQELTAAIKTNTDSQDDGTKVTEKSAKEIKKEQRAVKMQRMSAVGGPVAMAAGTAGMVAAMSGAPQTMTNFLFGISAVAGLLPLLANPIGIAVAAIAAVGVGMWKLSSDLKNASKEGAEFAKSVTMTNSKLIELSKITGSVSATESAKRQRQNILSGASGVQRKTGQTILESDFGKGLIKDIETQQKSGASDADVAKSVSLGLSTAIMQGVLTTEQARSLAAALGEKLGSYDIPAQISGNIVRLVGPNGERLDSQPLQVALEIKKQSMEQQAQVFQNAMSQRRKTLGTAGEFAAAGAMVGVGALAGGPVGAAVGAGVAIKMLFDQNKLKAENLKLDTAAIQLGFETVAQGQGLVDSLNKQYDNKIKQAKTEEEVSRLEAERKTAIDAVNKENAKTLDILIEQKNQFSPGAFDAAIKAAADTMYKEGPMAVFKDQTIKALSELEDSKFKTMLQLGFASGEMDPNQILAFVNMAKDNPTLKTNFDFIVNTQGMAEANVLVGLLQKAGANQQTYEIVTKFLKENPKEFKDIQGAIAALGNILPKYGVKVDINTVGIKQLRQIDRITTTLKNEKGPITQEIIAKYAKDPNNPDQSIYQGILDTWTTLVGSSETITKEMIIDFGATYSDPNVKDFFDASKGLSGVPEHIRQMAGGSSAESSAYLVGTGKGSQTGGKTGTGVTKGDKTGDRDTTLDELLKRLKFIRKASIDAQGGVKELLRITGGEGLRKFVGVTQQLLSGGKGGFNREFISFLESMDEKTRKTYMTIENGEVILTKQGKALKKAFNEKVIGEYQVAQFQALQDTKAQGAALAKLKSAGVDTATALEMVADANLAVAINSKNISSKELQDMAKAAKDAKAALKEAFNEKVIVDYQVAQFQAAQDTKAQGAALLKLKAAGVDTATALDMVSDANLAVAISSKNISSKELQNMAKAAKDAKAAQEALNLALKNQAVSSKQNLSNLNDTAKVISALKSMGPGITPEQLDKVRSSPEFMRALYKAIYEDAKTNTAELSSLLDDAAKERTATFKVEVQIDAAAAIQNAINSVLSPAQGMLDLYKDYKSKQIAATSQFAPRIAKAEGDIAKATEAAKAKAAAQAAKAKIVKDKQNALKSAKAAAEEATKEKRKAVKDAQEELKRQQDALKKVKNNPQYLAAQAALKERDKLIEVEQKNIEDARDLISGYQKQIEGFKEKIDAIMADVKAKFDDKIDAIRNQIESIQRDVALKYDAQISKLTQSIENIGRHIEENFTTPITKLQDDSSALGEELSEIDSIADKINEKYDAQAEALEKVKSLNQEIAEQQRGQLDLADALRSGDASAAARAIQQSREAAAQRAAERTAAAIAAGRQAEIAGIKSGTGKTRAQITAMQEDLAAQIKTVQNAQKEYEISVGLKGLKDELAQLERNRADELRVVEGLEIKILELEKQRAAFLATKKGELDKLEADIKAKEADIKAKEKEIEKIEAEIDRIKKEEKFVKAEADIDRLEKAIETAEKEVEAAEVELDKAEADAAAAAAKAQIELDKAEADAAAAAAKAQIELDKAEAALTKAEEDLEKALEAQDKAEAALAALEAELAAETEKELKDLIKALADAEAALAKAFKDAIADNKLLETAIANLQTGTINMQKAVADVFKSISEDSTNAANAIKSFMSAALETSSIEEGPEDGGQTGMTNAQLIASRGGYIRSDQAAALNAAKTSTAKNKGSSIDQIAASLKSAKPDAEALAKSQEAINKSIGIYAPLAVQISDKLALDAVTIKTISDSYAAIAPLVKEISKDSAAYSAHISTSRDSLSPQPSVWERIKGFISNAVAAIDSYVSKIQGALTNASNLASTIASLERTVTTTHVIRTINIVDTVIGTTTSSGSTSTTAKNKAYGGKITGYMGGGRVKPIYRPMGGLIPYMADGGFRPMGSDTVPAMLTPGEYVVNKSATKSFLPLLTALNESKFPSSLANRLSGSGKNIKITDSFNKPNYQLSEVSSSSFIQPVFSEVSSSSFIQPVFDVSNVSVTNAPLNRTNQSVNNNSSSVYNYSVGITVGGTNASPDAIAKSVMKEIKYLDSQRIREQRAV